MKNLHITGALALTLALLQSTPTCFAQTDLLYDGGATGTFSATADWFSGFTPEVTFPNDSLTFGATPVGGATVDNDIVGLGAGLGSDPLGTPMVVGNRDDSAAIHFLDGSGDFTLTGLPITINSPSNAQLSAVRIEPTAGTLQTIENDIVLSRDAAARLIMLNTGSGGKLVLNGDIDFGAGGSWFFGDSNLDSPTHVELNGVGTVTGAGGGPAQSWRQAWP